MQHDLPDVGFMIREDVSENILAELMAELERTDIRFEVHRTPASPMMGIEWLLPTLVGVYLFKPFLEGFLKKAGEDSYIALKSVCSKFLAQSKSVDLKVVTGAPLKVRTENAYSRYFSIYIHKSNGDRVKFLLPSVISRTDSERLMDDLFILIGKHYCDSTGADELSKLTSLPIKGQMFLIAYDFEEGRWVAVNPFM